MLLEVAAMLVALSSHELELEASDTTPPPSEDPLTVLGSSPQAASRMTSVATSRSSTGYSNRRITSPWSMSASFAGTTSSTFAVSGNPAPP